MAAGALNLASPEVKIYLESAESSDPIDVEENVESHETPLIILPDLGFLVHECPFGGNHRLRQLHVHDLSIWRQFLGRCVDVLAPVRLGPRTTEQTQIAENARDRNEYMFVPSSDDNMSMRLSARYTVVPLAAASVSIGVSGCTKCDMSAISVHLASSGLG